MTNGASADDRPAADALAHGTEGAKAWIGCAFWVALGASALFVSRDLQVMTRFGPGPGFFVRGLAVAMLVLAAAQAIGILLAGRRDRGRLRPPSADNAAAILSVNEDETALEGGRGRLARFVLLAASLFAYGLLLEPLGFILSTVVLSFAAMVLLGRAPLRSIAESVVAVVLAYVLFERLLGVNLPGADIAPLAALGL